MGRKFAGCRLQKPIIDKIAKMMETGTSMVRAGVLCGVSSAQINRWRKEVREIGDRPPSNHKERLLLYMQKVTDEATAIAIEKYVSQIRAIGISQRKWEAIAWLLKKRAPEEFGDEQKIDMKVSQSPMIEALKRAAEQQKQKYDNEIEEGVKDNE